MSTEFGLTYREIEADGFRIDEKVEIFLGSDTSVGIAKSMGLALAGFAEVYERLKPDIIVGMGDRFELFSAVTAACVSRIPIAHLSGGEITEGAIDDAFRHAITKMSHLHFTSTEGYRRRVIQLGEDPQRVFNVGEIGLDNLKEVKFLPKKKLEDDLSIKFKKHNLLVTFHPVTLEKGASQNQFQQLLEVLDDLNDTQIIFTKANADMEGRRINRMIDEFVSQRTQKATAVASLGHQRYVSLVKLADAVVGNSSSGIVEAPSLSTPTINIGDRQKGRIKARSVVDCLPTRDSIKKAFKKVYSKEFRQQLKNVQNPLGDGQSAERVKRILKEQDLKDILKKKFYGWEPLK